MAKVKKTIDTRPRIWADGHQKPPFQPRAFALASVVYARESLSGLLSRCGDTAAEFGQTVATGRWRVPEHRLGRTGRFLPSAQATASAILGGAKVLTRAARVAMPALDDAPKMTSIFDAPATAPAPLRPADVEQPEPPPIVRTVAKPVSAAPSPAADDPDLQAIRALMDAAVAAPPRQARAVQTLPEASPEPAPRVATVTPLAETGWRREWLADTVAQLLGYGLLVVTVPWGAGRAVLAHLNGEDLRKLVDQG